MPSRAATLAPPPSLIPPSPFTQSLLDAIFNVSNPITTASHTLNTATKTSPTDPSALTYIQVIVSLATLQSAVSDLSRAYINHANTVLNRGPSTLDLGSITSSLLLENGLLGGTRGLSPGRPDALGAGAGGAPVPGKMKRKRAPHDPNAPKRALTPYFLYMQHNRATIAEELGANARPKEVADEGTRRWAEMTEEEKSIWKKLYADNLAVYHEKMRAYKAGLPVPDDDTTQAAAAQLHQGVHHATTTVLPTHTHEASTEESDESDEESADEDEEEEEEASPEPVKAPTPPRSNKRRRTAGGTVADAGKPAMPAGGVSGKKGSPEKRKGAGKKEKEEVTASGTKSKRGSTAATVAAATEMPRGDKKGKKKRKSEAAE
ncbi:uncharacterized protein PADG_03869 [Paracoccidioides brasiliensis Pb18]|uniref:HMG box domain-containing protein n=2 Tax=Paracoccidioides brasiliensis TaxID=121759 RepID=C1G9D3_PARBD|nr:uncharacterized protein PADG_03869 [Paracoccidioides brasiliensis Pb18]EEH47785.2 hypothetical protein PADG_03869 [Paracoccidioides brasiliensis Pb18]ODH33670.1 hypothetical protein ACO22_03288 [Paracoccidioides brasiliensis]ODH50653.1 hypothetical protein GX48_03161 [Paracoccidioides brasiliensis]